MNDIPKPFWFRHRYSLRSLLIALSVAMLVIAAYAAGYHNGIMHAYSRFLDDAAGQQSSEK
jgi:hypothetical protein